MARHDDEFEDFFRAQHPRLVAIALAFTGDVEAARDAAQEALARAFRDWDRVGALDLPSAWVRRVLIDLAVDGRRRRGRDARLASRLAALPQRDAAAPDEQSSVWRAVRTLPPRQRAVAVLRDVDMSVADVARVLGVIEGTVETALHDARATLRNRLAEEDT